MVDLLFDRSPATSNNLVFGETDAPPTPVDNPVTVSLALPGPTLSVHATLTQPVRVQMVLPGPTIAVHAQYISGAARPLVRKTDAPHQVAVPAPAQIVSAHSTSLYAPSDKRAHWQTAAPLRTAVQSRHDNAERLAAGTTVVQQHAWRTGLRPVSFRYQVADRTPRVATTVRQQWAVPTGVPGTAIRYQDGVRLRNGAATAFQKALGLHVARSDRQGKAQISGLQRGVRHQVAIKPPAGMHLYVVLPPEQERCYTPSGELVFTQAWDGTSDLLFICERHDGGPVEPGATVVVPVKEVYFVINSATLRRVDGNIDLPVLGMSLRLDVQSWTWGFSAQLDGRALTSLEPANYGDPVELEATINGVAYRVLAEGIARERTFGRASIAVTGRGKSAVLDSPYAPVLNFDNAAGDRTAQQLAGDVLTINGVNNGWSVDWQPDDWLVPAGVWSHQGTHISALNAIAGALGGCLQPHPIDATVAILARYPSAPWEWATATPDFELPSAATTREGIEWVDRPAYNRVFVSGVGAGVLGQVTRTGTAGDRLAPMVTDALTTHADAARQRGLSVLADVGRQASVSLKLPVLAETGIILPGSMVRYTDAGVNRIGIVRGMAVDVALPQIWQNLTVETHVDA